jgi:hypothetical protein
MRESTGTRVTLLNSFRSGSAGFNDRHCRNYLSLQNRSREKEKNDDRGLSVLPPVGALTLLQDPARGLRSWNLSRGAAPLTRACC